jgi:hypothetical protein
MHSNSTSNLDELKGIGESSQVKLPAKISRVTVNETGQYNYEIFFQESVLYLKWMGELL